LGSNTGIVEDDSIDKIQVMKAEEFDVEGKVFEQSGLIKRICKGFVIQDIILCYREPVPAASTWPQTFIPRHDKL
jgi:glucose-6-phosphate 1-dehydrogenase